MPSVFQTLLAPARVELQATFGVSCVYSKGGVNSPVFLARKGTPSTTMISESGRTVDYTICVFSVDMFDLANPAKDGRLTVNGNEVWSIEKDPETINGWHRLACRLLRTERRGEMRASNNA